MDGLMNKIKFNNEDEIKLIDSYKSGLSINKVAKKYKVSNTVIFRILKENNIKLRSLQETNRKYSFDKSFFKVIDTQEKAYFLGFLYADGCIDLSRKTAVIELQNTDIEILEKLNKSIKNTKPLIYKKSRRCSMNLKYICKPTVQLEITGTKTIQDLINLGCTPKKSLTLEFPTEQQVPKHLIRHFIRGYFDGDGWITYIEKESLKVKAGFISTTKFLNILKNILLSFNIHTRLREYKETNGISYLDTIRQKSILKLFDFLYKNDTISLNRKKEKFNKVIKIINQRISKYKYRNMSYK